MDGDDMYPAEMPNRPPNPIPALDADTAERLLAGRLDPDDAPPAYAEVARLLHAAAAPPCPDELAGQPAALAAFRAVHAGATRSRGRRRAGMRGRLLALALAGALVIGGAAGGAAAGLWTADGIPSFGWLRSPTGGPGAGGSGSATSGSGGPGGGVQGARPATTTKAEISKGSTGRAEEAKGKPPKGEKPEGKPGKGEKPKAKPPKKPKDKPAKAEDREAGEPAAGSQEHGNGGGRN